LLLFEYVLFDCCGGEELFPCVLSDSDWFFADPELLKQSIV
jgi:hypothetical protein